MPAALASASFTINAQYGFEGKGRFNTTIPVTVIITNEGEDFSGQLVTTFPESYQLQTGQVYPLTIEAGETKKLQFFLANYPEQHYYNNQGEFFHIFKGDIESGQKVKDVTINEVKPTMYGIDSNVIATFDNEVIASALQKLRSLNKEIPIEVIALNTDVEALPEDVRELAMFSTILLDNTDFSNLSLAQQETLYEWVEQGGQLVTDGSIDESVFAEDAALAYESGQKLLTTKQLHTFAKDGTFYEDINVQQVKVQDDATSFEVDGIILGANHPIGKGMLIQTAFPLSAAPLVEMDGYANVINEMLQFNQHQFNLSGTTIHDEIANQMADVNELFPSFAFSTWKIIGVLALYVLLIGPLLYLVLKRKDKREQAWWIIPAISLVFSIAFFFYGAKDRLISPQLQQSAVWKVMDSGSEQYFIQSVLANKSGDFTFKLQGETTAAAYKMGEVQLANPNKEKWGYVEQTEDGSQITLKNVNYWGVQSIVGYTKTSDQQKFDIQLQNDNGHLTGTITNTFAVDIENVQLWTGTTFIKLGSLQQGETITIDEQIVSTILLPVSTLRNNYDSAIRVEELAEKRYERLLSFAHSTMYSEQLPAIIGEAKHANIGGELLGKASITSSTLIVQPLDVPTTFSGSVTLTNDAFTRELTSKMYEGHPEKIISEEDGRYFENGEYTLRYSLPATIKNVEIDWEHLSLALTEPRISMKIYNGTTEKFEDISANYSSTNAHDYISDKGQIELQLIYSSDDYGDVAQLPKLTLKGEKSHD